MATDKQAEMTFTQPCCATCAAWKQTQGLNGECHLMPPQALFAGFQQPPQVQGLQLNGRLPPQPIILGAFPAVNAQNICRQWQPDAPLPSYDTMKETAFVPGEGLVTREVPFSGEAEKVPECPVPGGTYLPSAEDRAAEGAKHQGELAQDE